MTGARLMKGEPAVNSRESRLDNLQLLQSVTVLLHKTQRVPRAKTWLRKSRSTTCSSESVQQPSPADERLCGATVVIDIGIK